MARYSGPVCRLCRREGAKLFLKGERCYTKKCSVDRRSYAPGQHGQGRKRYRNTENSCVQSSLHAAFTVFLRDSSVITLKWRQKCPA